MYKRCQTRCADVSTWTRAGKGCFWTGAQPDRDLSNSREQVVTHQCSLGIFTDYCT